VSGGAHVKAAHFVPHDLFDLLRRRRCQNNAGAWAGRPKPKRGNCRQRRFANATPRPNGYPITSNHREKDFALTSSEADPKNFCRELIGVIEVLFEPLIELRDL
jgi:hypothetical protein